MSKIIISILALICVLNNSVLFGNELHQEIHNDWTFRQVGLDHWYAAKVPGVVHLDLMANNLIDDPYYALNERGMQWIDKEDWEYKTTFNVLPEILEKQNIFLRFKGLDTFADVYLNEEKILTADNMFREWEVDVKGKLKPEENTIRIYFHSPTGTALKAYLKEPFPYISNNDQSHHGGFFDMTVSMFARKAGYHFGWDWGPRLATSGIWRPLFVEAWNDIRIDDIYFRQQEVTMKNAALFTEIDLSASTAMKGLEILIKDVSTGEIYTSDKVDIDKGDHKLKLNFTIKNPKLWWSNGLGEPNLYTFRTELKHDGKLIGSKDVTTGLRSIKLIRDKDDAGRSFYFELNGKPVFMKGANYIPCDVFLPRVTDSLLHKTLSDAKEANMNMIRIWGGGIYEEDSFYEMCDRMGLMVWHDFMFACAIYPAKDEFLENIKQEAIYNVKRLRNHPSIVLWCGNNEVQECWFSEWGNWRSRYTVQQQHIIWEGQNLHLFDTVLRQIVDEYTELPYTPTSPFSRYDGVAQGNEGDLHFWEVWFALNPVDTYNQTRGRFFSEYGFQSFPTMETIHTFTQEPKDYDPFSEIMMFHQRSSPRSNWMMAEYMRREIREPKDFTSFVYMSHVMQAYAVKTAIEAHRRDMFYCGGTIFWQHNDCWPAISWSSRDYYGRWKALQYWAKKAYTDILVSPIAKDDEIQIYLVSDRAKNTSGKLVIDILTFNGGKIAHIESDIKVPANASHVVWSTKISELLGDTPKEDVVLTARYTDKTGSAYTNNYLLVTPGKAALPKVNPGCKINPVEGGFELILNADKFAKAVYLSAGNNTFFSDNYFDILPGESIKILAQTNLNKIDFEKKLQVISLVDSY